MKEKKYTADSIMELVKQLPIGERMRLQSMLKEPVGKTQGFEEYLTEQRFSGGRVCPVCGGTHVQRNGRRKNGTQKFICRDCGKTFSITKNTIFNGTRKDMSVWMRYMECMAEGLSLTESAERCGISYGTSFIWRHKILDSVGESLKGTDLTGIVEADETYIAESYKGDKKKFKGGEAGRKPRKRGGESHTRGLSDELVCVPCAIDRKGNAVSKVAKLGKCSTKAVREVLGGHVSPEATLCTDEDASYRGFSMDNGNSLVQIKGGKKTVKGIYHIQHLNAYHSKLKLFLAGFRGVSSKYLNNYLIWNNVVEHRTGTLREKVARMMRYVASAMFEEACKVIPLRPSLPVLVKNQS